MRESTKICAMCRKEVDSSALLCAFCRSDTNYHLFIPLSPGDMTRSEHKFKALVSAIIIMTITLTIGFMGIAIAGLLAGIGFGIFALFITYWIVDKTIQPADVYQVEFKCPDCGGGEIFMWKAGEFDLNRSGKASCSSCNLKIRVTISA